MECNRLKEIFNELDKTSFPLKDHIDKHYIVVAEWCSNIDRFVSRRIHDIYTFHEDKTSRHGWMKQHHTASSTQIPLSRQCEDITLLTNIQEQNT